MSSQFVRDTIRTFFDDNFDADTSKRIADIDGEFEDLKEFLTNNSHPITNVKLPIGMTEDWIGLQYGANLEQPVSVPATNTTGTYRETGFVSIHIVAKAAIGVNRKVLARCETVQNTFRGRDINGIRIQSIIPANFSNGATLDFVGGGFVSATVTLTYECDKHL